MKIFSSFLFLAIISTSNFAIASQNTVSQCIDELTQEYEQSTLKRILNLSDLSAFYDCDKHCGVTRVGQQKFFFLYPHSMDKKIFYTIASTKVLSNGDYAGAFKQVEYFDGSYLDFGFTSSSQTNYYSFAFHPTINVLYVGRTTSRVKNYLGKYDNKDYVCKSLNKIQLQKEVGLALNSQIIENNLLRPYTTERKWVASNDGRLGILSNSEPKNLKANFQPLPINGQTSKVEQLDFSKIDANTIQVVNQHILNGRANKYGEAIDLKAIPDALQLNCINTNYFTDVYPATFRKTATGPAIPGLTLQGELEIKAKFQEVQISQVYLVDNKSVIIDSKTSRYTPVTFFSLKNAQNNLKINSAVLAVDHNFCVPQ